MSSLAAVNFDIKNLFCHIEPMAITFVDVQVSNPAKPEIKEKLSFLVDSGAIYSVVPATVLKKLGILSDEEREFTLADGRKVTRKMSGAKFEYNSRHGHAPVIFGEKDDSTLLGATTLEAMGVALDPLKRQIMPLPMILG